MLHSGSSTGLVGYNIKTAVDGKHQLIVAHEVTKIGLDRAQLTKMSEVSMTSLYKWLRMSGRPDGAA